MKAENQRPKEQLQSLGNSILLAFLLVGLALVFWSVLRAPDILAREDNPRLVEAALRLQRGRILDTNNAVLAETVGPADDLRRLYPLPYAGPAVGYYSFRHGTAGVEAAFDETLQGVDGDDLNDFWQQALRQPQAGRDVRLTLDARWQRTADALLAENQGAIVLLSLPEAAVRAMVSHPAYDPNVLDEEFDELVSDERAPLLNRAIQGEYQPGLVLQPFLLAAGLQQNLMRLNSPVENSNSPITYGETVLRCATPPPLAATWADVLAHACPAPMLPLAGQLGIEGLAAIFTNFGLTAAPDLLPTAQTLAGSANPLIDDPALAVIGQDNLTVTPLQISLALAALANDGRLPSPQLVMAVQDESGQWQPQPAGVANEARQVVPAAAAQAILAALPRHESLSEYATLALAGPGGSQNSWYLGLAPAGAPQYLVVVLVEDSESAFEAQRLGRALLNAILAPR